MYSWCPLVLMPEEVVLLVENGAAHHLALLVSSYDSTLQN